MAEAPAVRAAAWAVPITIPGLPNLHKVSPNLYRGAQPDAVGFRELERMGVRTVINLRLLHGDEALIAGTGLTEVRIPSEAWEVDDDEVVEFLRIAADPKRTPVFVHCQHGADRTGTMVAAYRIVVQGWEREEAIREMTEGGFSFHPFFINLPNYLRGMDVTKIRREVGTGSPGNSKGHRP
jgi:protein tyrosine/serine phosphatase